MIYTVIQYSKYINHPFIQFNIKRQMICLKWADWVTALYSRKKYIGEILKNEKKLKWAEEKLICIFPKKI